MKRLTLAVAFFFALGLFFYKKHSSSKKQARDVSSFANLIVPVNNLPQFLKNSETFDLANAVTVINTLSDKTYQLTGEEIFPDSESENEEFDRQANNMVNSLFTSRLILKERQYGFENELHGKRLERPLIDAFRRAHLYLRYAEDYVVEWMNQRHQLQNQADYFSGTFPLVLRNKNIVDKFEVRPGDIFLIRGNSFVSATIARSGDVVSNMSHLAMAAEDEKGNIVVIESLLEKGPAIYPVKKFLTLEPLPRVALYRHRDATVAKKAGMVAWKLYNELVSRKTEFDLEMDFVDHKKVYCAELVAMAYERAAGKLEIPKYQTSFERARRTEFFIKLGMGRDSSFAPADVEVDPNFTLVAEYRDLHLLPKSRRYDVILSKLFEMLEGGYTYRFDSGSLGLAFFGKLARQLGFQKDKIPKNVSLQKLTQLVKHQKLVDNLEEKMARKEIAAKERLQRPLTFRELEDIFEKVCKKTCLRDP